MEIVDANIILRYLLDDHEKLSPKAREIIENNTVTIPIEVLCEVVFVLRRVYDIGRGEIGTRLLNFLSETNCVMPNREVILKGLEFFTEKNLDFVDCILAGYATIHGTKINTFDHKLQKLIAEIL